MSSRISSAFTCHSRCARSLLNGLSQSLKREHRPSSGQGPVLLFALAPSPTTPAEVLSDIISTLTQFHLQHVGCISAPLPHQYCDPTLRGGSHSCSLSYAFVEGVPFRSTILGRVEPQVGRWHAARQRTGDPPTEFIGDFSEFDGKIDWEDVWNRTTHSAARSQSSESESQRESFDPKTLPDALQNLDPSVVENILYFSDKAPEGLESVLDGAFPQANKLSLIASSTPFITGRPVTLFHNGSILSTGAVGVVFNPSPSSPPEVELSFPPLVALSHSLNVTGSEGNLILSLDSGNPTQLLLSAIRKHGLSSSHTTWIGKEDEFYVAVVDPSNQRISQLHRISAGDPSRGTLALDTPLAPKEGAIVRLYHLPRDHGRDVPRCTSHLIPNSISLFVAPPAASFEDKIVEDSDQVVISDAFVAASENGFTLSHRAQGPWKCVVPGGRMRLSWV